MKRTDQDRKKRIEVRVRPDRLLPTAMFVGMIVVGLSTLIAFPLLAMTFNTDDGGWGILWMMVAGFWGVVGGLVCAMGVRVGRSRWGADGGLMGGVGATVLTLLVMTLCLIGIGLSVP